MSERGWWYRASQEQKLAQIDAGVSLGMTAKAVALASGAVAASTVHDFAQRHGRYGFVEHAEEYAESGRRVWHSTDRRAPMRDAASAFYKGEAVDFWADKPAIVSHGAEPAEVILE